MPKILDVSKDKILDIAESVLKKDGYKALSIRKIAETGGMATGTFYLYFKSKDDLVAQVIVRNWIATTSEMQHAAQNSTSFEEGLVDFYDSVCRFSNSYSHVFAEYSKIIGSHETLTSRHLMLRSQLAAHIEKLAQNTKQLHLLENTDMIAECLLTAVNQPDMNASTLQNFIKLITK